MSRRFLLPDSALFPHPDLIGGRLRRRMATALLSVAALASAALIGCTTPGLMPADMARVDPAPADMAPADLPTTATSPTPLAWTPVDGATGLLYAKDVATPGQVLHWLRLDLQDPTLVLTLTPPRDKGRPLDQFEGATRALAAVNASFFSRQFEPRGWTVSAGEAWHPVLAAADSPLLHCDAQQHCDMQLTPPVPAPPPGGLAVAGTPWLLRDGIARQPSDDDPCNFCKVRHPRTAVGLDASRRFLTMVLVEGRQAEALGMTLSELAQRMRAQGVTQGLNLDGGGSTALLLQGQRVTGRPFNEPSLRPLANALLIRHASTTPRTPTAPAPPEPHK